jgi:hypothetical protein
LLLLKLISYSKYLAIRRPTKKQQQLSVIFQQLNEFIDINLGGLLAKVV